MKYPVRRDRKYLNKMATGGNPNMIANTAIGLGTDFMAWKNSDEFSDNTNKGKAIGGGIGAGVGLAASFFGVPPVVGMSVGQQLGSAVGGWIGGKQDEKDIKSAKNSYHYQMYSNIANNNFANNSPLYNPELGYKYGGKLRYKCGGKVKRMQFGGNPPYNTPSLSYEPPTIGKKVTPDGKTEFTETIEIDGKFYNIPSIIGGKEVDPMDTFRKTGIHYGVYDNLDEAVSNAEKRSLKNSFINDPARSQQIIMQFGGDPNMPVYEAEKDEVIVGDDTQMEDGSQLASNVMEVGGNTHEQGGTAAAGGDFVYSDSLPLTQEIKDLTKKYVASRKKGTYADLAKSLGKLKGRYEKILNGRTTPTEAKTAEAMISKTDGLLEAVAENQEMLKSELEEVVGEDLNNMGFMAYGGNTRKMVLGGNPPYKPNTNMEQESGTYAATDIDMTSSYGSTLPSTSGYSSSSKNRFKLPNLSDKMEGIEDYAPDIINTAALMANLGDINKIKKYDSPMPTPIATSTFFRNRYGSKAIKDMFSTMVRRGMSSAAIQNAYANAVKAMGEQEAQQTALEVDNRNRNTMLINEAGARNIAAENQVRMANVDLENQKITDRTRARGAYLNNMAANAASRRAADLDLDKLILSLAADTTGVSEDYIKRAKEMGISTSTYRKLNRTGKKKT
jgi:hypothetical protein